MLQRLVRERIFRALGCVEMPPLGRHADEPGPRHRGREPPRLAPARAGERARRDARPAENSSNFVGSVTGAPSRSTSARSTAAPRLCREPCLRVGDVARIGDPLPQRLLDRRRPVAVPDQQPAILRAQALRGASRAASATARRSLHTARGYSTLAGEVVVGRVAHVDHRVGDHARRRRRGRPARSPAAPGARPPPQREHQRDRHRQPGARDHAASVVQRLSMSTDRGPPRAGVRPAPRVRARRQGRRDAARLGRRRARGRPTTACCG